MEPSEFYDIQSENLKTHWNVIGPTFIKANEMNLDDGSNNKVFHFLLEEWKRLYHSFVLYPIKNAVIDGFHFVQTQGFEREGKIKETATAFRVYYYLAQYFSLMIRPNQMKEPSIENFPEYEIHYGDANRELFMLLNEILEELDNRNSSDTGSFEDIDGYYYETELEYLHSFLSDCWNETKNKTGSTAIAILSEATAADYDYLLDEKRKLSSTETTILERQ